MKLSQIQIEITDLLEYTTLAHQIYSSLYFTGEEFIICWPQEAKPGYTLILPIESWMSTHTNTKDICSVMSEKAFIIINQFRQDK